nr:solute carrier organic anion transporter family member 74D-like [Osmia lignaria]XP_034185771.1 solute carrier organic anion transporter family member 74D-like [Osmia lignaria]
MTIRLQEVVRSEVEGGLAGPANPIPSQSIDCGCAQLRCPKLAKYATRRLFVGLLSWVGLIQAAAYAYLYVVGHTIARRFQFDPYVMEWVLLISDLIPFFLGLLIAYWGNRIHRASWIGAIVLLQSVSYFSLIIPHLTHQTRIIEDTENVTHMALYSDDHRELCSEVTASIIAEGDSPCYFTFGVLIAVQIITGVSNIAYFALGLSYLDDNTKTKHVAAFIGVVIGVKILGILLGYILAWGCLRIDAVTLTPVESYREQIGAWWLGLPILTLLLIVPGLLLSWFPRMLPSQVVERAAASLLSSSDRYISAPRRLISQKVGSPNFWPSVGRLFVNKTLICHVLACTLYLMATVNFMAYENLIAESRFHVPKPTGTLLGFDDPMPSRIVSNMLKPILIGLIIITSGLVIAKAKPNARSIIGYNIIIIFLSAGIIFALSATSCMKKPIVGTDSKGSLQLLRYCNKDCRCSADADFRPVCDIKGMYTFYSPCHAGCTSSDYKNGITMYDGCRCVQAMPGSNSMEAIDGPCGLNGCQVSWLSFEFGTLLVYILIASTFVGDFLILLRSAHTQDKAISVGFWLMWSALIVNVPGKILYEVIANLTCQYWGTRRTTCRLHDSSKLGDFLCYVTGSLLVLSVLLKMLLWIFSEDLKLYVQKEEATAGAEMQELIQNTAATSRQKTEQPNTENDNETTVQVEPRRESTPPITNISQEDSERQEAEKAPLKYGPLGPGDRRTDSKSSLNQISQTPRSTMRYLDSEDDLSSSDDDRKDPSPKVAYKPLDLDSDVESDLVNVPPRSRKRISSKEYDSSSPSKREFPNPDNYDDPRLTRQMRYNNADGSSETSSFEYSKQRHENEIQTKGDFNEVGIPIVDSIPSGAPRSDSRFMKDVKSLINKYELNAEQQASGDQGSVKSGGSVRSEGKIVSGIPLVAMASKKPSSRNPSSSGFSSIDNNRSESRESNSPKTSSKGSVGTLHTDF